MDICPRKGRGHGTKQNAREISAGLFPAALLLVSESLINSVDLPLNAMKVEAEQSFVLVCRTKLYGGSDKADGGGYCWPTYTLLKNAIRFGICFSIFVLSTAGKRSA